MRNLKKNLIRTMYDWRSFLCYITNNYVPVIPEGQREANVLGVAGIPILYIIILILEAIEALI